jgi:hypothetical protein
MEFERLRTDSGNFIKGEKYYNGSELMWGDTYNTK